VEDLQAALDDARDSGALDSGALDGIAQSDKP